MKLLCLTNLLFFVSGAYAQQPAAPAAGASPIVVRPYASQTQVTVVPVGEDQQRAETVDGESTVAGGISETPAKPLSSQHKRWSRPAGGVWGSLMNSAVLSANSKITSDKILADNGSELAFGAGGQFDFGIHGEGGAQGLRVRAGLQRVSLSPDDAVLASYSADQLESTAWAASMALLYRMAPDLGYNSAVIWYGGGLQINHFFSTNASGASVSKLAGAYGFNMMLAAGADIPLTDVNDVGVEVDWFPRSHWGLVVCYRTTL
ncbi:MAG: hypothetical protein JST16_03285 [Bdellovibrionales bacterium]|nr:hypothetical protein [Bdellovibrionales bacterium]